MIDQLRIHYRSLFLFLVWGMATAAPGIVRIPPDIDMLVRQISPMAFGAAFVGFQFEVYRARRERVLADLYREIEQLIAECEGQPEALDHLKGRAAEQLVTKDLAAD